MLKGEKEPAPLLSIYIGIPIGLSGKNGLIILEYGMIGPGQTLVSFVTQTDDFPH